MLSQLVMSVPVWKSAERTGKIPDIQQIDRTKWQSRPNCGGGGGRALEGGDAPQWGGGHTELLEWPYTKGKGWACPLTPLPPDQSDHHHGKQRNLALGESCSAIFKYTNFGVPNPPNPPFYYFPWGPLLWD